MSEGLALVDRAMHEQLDSTIEVMPLIGGHVLSSGGKRLRPILVLLSAQLCGYTGSRSVQLGAALELVHTATLLHDDVVDLSELRRGQPSANAIWGNRRAVLAGDFFYGRASSMIVEDGSLAILEIFSNTIRMMAEGELIQLQRSFDTTISERQYYQVIERKSAVLLSAACEVGAVLGEVTRGESRRVAEFGRELGIAFQVRDDVIDFQSDEVTLGKPHCADLREGKVTLPLLLTLKRCTTSEREVITSTLKDASRVADLNLVAGDGDESHESHESHEANERSESMTAPRRPAELDFGPVLALIERYRGIEDSMRRAEEHRSKAAAAIAAFPESRAKRSLLDLRRCAKISIPRGPAENHMISTNTNTSNKTSNRTDIGASPLPHPAIAGAGPMKAIDRAPRARGSQLRRGLALVAALMLALAGVAQAAQAAETVVRLSGVVNLNTADVEQLQMLPGVGEKRAAAIIEIRSAKGGFKSVEEIVEVKGVGDALFKRMQPHLTLSGKTTARLL
ncbi:MAG: polyprenyl synthetase family protein [Deltaproteobacteria bacterium]|nr:polyprenyl synthetase family protein [Deltaproteobacteria bacterium]